MANKTIWEYLLLDKMSGGIARILRNKDKLDAGLGATERRTNGIFSRLGNKMRSFSLTQSGALEAISAVAPGAAAGLTALVNPIVLAGAAAAATAALLGKATTKAAEFQNVFLELKNLNLDKTRGEIDLLNKKVLDTAFATGRAPEAMSRAFFDIQSITGAYGDEVEKTASKIGLFSKAVKSDFNEQVTASAVAMKAFGFQADQMDKFLASSFKTVQVGKVTFEELARVQTDYAGAAVKSFQSFDSANQLFAVFTGKAKSAEEAATLTKSAFQDLFKDSTVTSFKKALDINLFDPMTGLPKQLDQIVGEMNMKFKELGGSSPEKLNALVNQFKGSEGLVALVGEAAFNGDAFLKTIEDFNRTDFNLDKALGNANQDLVAMREELDNRVNVLMIKLGQQILPIAIKAVSFLNKTLEAGVVIWEAITEKSLFLKDLYTLMKIPLDAMLAPLRGIWNAVAGVYKLIEAKGSFVSRFFEGFEATYRIVRNAMGNLLGGMSKLFEAGGAALAQQFGLAARLGKEGIDQLSNLNANSNGPGKRSDNPLGRFLKKTPGKGLPTIIDQGDGCDGEKEGNKRGPRVTTVTGGGGGGRQINVTIQKLVENITVSTTTLQQGVGDIQRQIEQALVRAVRDSEIALSSD